MTVGIVLAGGRSSRMGRCKTWLPLNGEPMLSRTVRVVGEVCECVIVVAAKYQTLPPLPDTVTVLRDDDDYPGPLAGFHTALKSLPATTDPVILVSCDLPHLTAAFLAFLLTQLDEYDAVVPRIDGHVYPLCGVYREYAVHVTQTRLDQGHRRFQILTETLATKYIGLDDIPLSLRHPPPWQGVNTAEEWEAFRI